MFNGEDLNILVIGLNSSGKTTLINTLKPSVCQLKEIKPTNGYETPWIPFRQYRLRFRDMGGLSNFRPLWQNHTDGLEGIIYVVDSSDMSRLSTAKEELFTILEQPNIQARPIPILIYANKNDLEESVAPDIIKEGLDLNSISGHPINMVSCCALYEKDIIPGLDWLIMRRAKPN